MEEQTFAFKTGKRGSHTCPVCGTERASLIRHCASKLVGNPLDLKHYELLGRLQREYVIQLAQGLKIDKKEVEESQEKPGKTPAREQPAESAKSLPKSGEPLTSSVKTSEESLEEYLQGLEKELSD